MRWGLAGQRREGWKSKSTFLGAKKFFVKVGASQLSACFTGNKVGYLPLPFWVIWGLNKHTLTYSPIQRNVSVRTSEIWEEEGLLSADTQSTPLQNESGAKAINTVSLPLHSGMYSHSTSSSAFTDGPGGRCPAISGPFKHVTLINLLSSHAHTCRKAQQGLIPFCNQRV